VHTTYTALLVSLHESNTTISSCLVRTPGVLVPSMAAPSPQSAMSPPVLSVSLALSSSNISAEEEVELSVTVISHASAPITIFTWPTIFNIHLVLKRKNFECIDLDTNTPLDLEITKGGKRGGFTSRRGSSDEKYFYTLLPEKPLKFTSPFKIANRRGLIPGHRYRFGVRRGEKLEWWAAGTKEEVLTLPGEPAGLAKNEDRPIELNNVEDIEFVIKGGDI
jgi:hypothetical protein